MTIREVINKLALELAFATGDLENIAHYKKYLRMALVVGTEHFINNKEEIVAMDYEGVEQGRYNSIRDAARKLGLDPSAICKVVNGRSYSHGGYLFIRRKETELVKMLKNQNTILLP
jgi:hypothetical protein